VRPRKTDREREREKESKKEREKDTRKTRKRERAHGSEKEGRRRRRRRRRSEVIRYLAFSISASFSNFDVTHARALSFRHKCKLAPFLSGLLVGPIIARHTQGTPFSCTAVNAMQGAQGASALQKGN
jgi:hypothetical protein